jgi:phosphomannomutase/phosphoglucomutase
MHNTILNQYCSWLSPMSNRILFGTNGIRGIVNEELTPEFVTEVGIAVGTYFNAGNILIGCDSRTSSILFTRSAVSGLASAGCNIYEVGYAPTPAIQFAVKHFKMDGAVIITASHNPPEYNGIKVVASDGVEIPREEEVKIEETFFKKKFSRRKWNELGKAVSFPGILDVYKEAIKKHIDSEAIREKNFKVVIDPANSVGALVTPYLLRELGCSVITINAQLDGNFPGRLPEPKPKTLGGLAKTVRATGADLGIAHDGDADRCFFVDELGNICLGDKTGTIIIDYILQRFPNSVVVTPISSSRMLEDIVKRRGSELLWTEVGSTMVSKRMKEVNSVIGMEDNGGIFYAPHQPVRDGALASALMLEVLANSNRTLSQMIDQLPKYFIIKERIDCPNERKQKVLEKLLKQTENYRRITVDGVKVFFEDGSVLMRPSGTEAIYRVYVEAKDEERAREIANWGISLVEENL